MNSLYGLDGHLNALAVTLLASDSLPDDKAQEALAHIAACPACAARFAEAFAHTGPVVVPPPGFAVHTAARLMETRRAQGRRLLFYSLRVAVAACLALAFTFSGLLHAPQSLTAPPAQAPGQSITSTINARLQAFSQNLLNLEDIFHDQKKK